MHLFGNIAVEHDNQHTYTRTAREACTVHSNNAKKQHLQRLSAVTPNKKYVTLSHSIDRKGWYLPAGLPVITKLRKLNPENISWIFPKQYQKQAK